MQRYLKIIIPVFVLFAVIAVSLYLKKDIDSLSSSEANLSGSVMREIPAFQVYALDGKAVTSNSFLNKSKSFYVHIWGTWCGPCETEFPELLKFAEKAKEKNSILYLIAVSDELPKVQKFLTRFKSMPENVVILLDKDNQVMDKFGTFKVPETFLFDSTGVNKNKYVGPQDWSKDIFITQLSSL